MCSIDWSMLLEFCKVVLSWPPIVLGIVLILIYCFSASIRKFLERIEEGEVAGVKIKMAKALQTSSPEVTELDPARELVQAVAPAAPAPPQQVALPPDLAANAQAVRFFDLARQNPVEATKLAIATFERFQFERFLNYVFGSQVALLKHLRAKGSPASEAELQPFYRVALNAFERQTPYSFEEYMHFLQNWNAVTRTNDGQYELGSFGSSFLRYLEQAYPPGAEGARSL